MPISCPRRQLVCERQCEAVPHVVVTVGTLETRTRAVLGLLRAIKRNIVNRVRVGVTYHKVHTFPCPLRQGGLESVIDGGVAVIEDVDELQVRKLSVERATGLLAIPASNLRGRIGIYLVNVSHPVELHATISDVAHLKGGRRGQRLLDVEVPGEHIGRPQIFRYTEYVAGSCRAIDSGIEDRSGKRPVQARATHIDSGGSNRAVRARDTS